ncbi:methylated-DNA--[protein]-cysteine S-methyltransferase [Rhizobium sp. CFBP 8762]|nr:methylated-DNA--[protein]-cysteine S-methyltransferase [Rhizobium sp. CFBP 8762]
MRVVHFFKTYWPDRFRGVARTIDAIATGTAKHWVETDLLSRGTAFQQQVYDALRTIAVEYTASYTEIATQIDAPKAVRVVVHACADSALAVVILCHRVVRNDGTLSGYRWGVKRKQHLLNVERKVRSE